MDKDTKSLKTILNNTWWCFKLIFKSNPYLYLGIILVQVVGSITPFLRGKVFSQLIDSLINIHQSDSWRGYFIFYVLFAAIVSVFMFLQGQLSRIFDTQFQAHLRKSFIGKVSALDYQHLEGKKTANLISKVDEEFGWRIRQTATDLNNVFTNLISLSTITVIFLPKYPYLWFLIFFSQIPSYFIERYWVQKDWRLHEENSDKNKQMWDLNHQLRQKNFIAELRINNAVNFLFKKYSDIFDFFATGRVSLRKKQIPSEIGIISFSTIIYFICLFTLILDVKNNLITIGLFTFYFQSIASTNDFFRGLIYSSVSITENSYHIGNFRTVMNLKNIITGGSKKISQPFPPKIEFVDVSFKYPDAKRFVYQHLNLTIDTGEEIAIVGQNGAGKSTLIKLICHFYEPTSGQILVNGIDLKKTRTSDWHHQLSYLAQEFNHYGNLTLRENIALGNPSKIDDTRILAALKKADANFINKYPHKLDTVLSQRYGGEEPSWGQAQKIAIARVFYRNSPIIILDEPTASIDAVSEYKIFNRLYQEIKKKTLIIVSHRFSTVRNAKRIIVIDKGKIVEQGSHEQLLASKGLYAHSFNLQAKGYN